MDEQPAPLAPQAQNPPVHTPVQHWEASVHAVATSRQQLPLEHMSFVPAQHWALEVQPIDFSAKQQVPDVQEMLPPVQQSAAAEQPALPAAKQHLPDVQVMFALVEQQPDTLLHPMLAVAKQQVLDTQDTFPPAQHSDAPAHDVVLVATQQLPEVQLPEQQYVEPCAGQDCELGLQAHTPPEMYAEQHSVVSVAACPFGLQAQTPPEQ